MKSLVENNIVFKDLFAILTILPLKVYLMRSQKVFLIRFQVLCELLLHHNWKNQNRIYQEGSV